MSLIDGVLAKVFGTKTDREVKAMLPTVAAISALVPQLRELSDADLAARTDEFKARIAQGETLGHRGMCGSLDEVDLGSTRGFVHD